MSTHSLRDLRNNLGAVVREVAYTGQEAVITDNGSSAWMTTNACTNTLTSPTRCVCETCAPLVLRRCPRPAGEKLVRSRSDWRIQIGEYRIIYENDTAKTVTVLQVEHRRDAYR